MNDAIERTILIIANDDAVARALEVKLLRGVPARITTICMRFDQVSLHLTRSALEDVDLVITELLRPYRWLLRAEGVVLAERIVRMNKKVVIFSPYALADKLRSPIYWDAASDQDFLRIVLRSFYGDYLPANEIRRLRTFFGAILKAPAQHG